MTAIPPGRRYRVDEPAWFRKLCRAGHPLRVYGRPRSDKPGIARCRLCVKEYRAHRREVLREAARAGVPFPFPGKEWIPEPDWAVVDRLVNGDRPERVPGAEVFEAVRVLTARGWSITRTADRVRMSERTVVRIRKKIKKGLSYGQAST